jgi:hypothetical protein
VEEEREQLGPLGEVRLLLELGRDVAPRVPARAALPRRTALLDDAATDTDLAPGRRLDHLGPGHPKRIGITSVERHEGQVSVTSQV